MLLYLSLVRAVMGSSNAAPRSAVEREAQRIAVGPALCPPYPSPSPTANILPVLEGPPSPSLTFGYLE